MTAREPGARLVLTVGLTERPRSTACLATRPAAIITEGLEVLVQLVIAAMATEPSVICVWVPAIVTSTSFPWVLCPLPGAPSRGAPLHPLPAGNTMDEGLPSSSFCTTGSGLGL